MAPFTLECIDIDKQPFTLQSTVLSYLAKVNYEIAECTSGFV